MDKQEIQDLYNLTPVDIRFTFLGQPTAQTFASLLIWEKIFNENKFNSIIELGTWYGGLSLYLYLQSLRQHATFQTYDNVHWIDDYNVIKELDEIIKFTDHIIFRNVFELENSIKLMLEKSGQTLIFCDNGNKVKEFLMFSKYMKKGDIIGVHDWNKEIRLTDIDQLIDSKKLIPFYEQQCDEFNTTLRFFKRT